MLKIDTGILKQAEQTYFATMSDVNCGVRDPVITPFAMAMKLSGYEEVPQGGLATAAKLMPIHSHLHPTHGQPIAS